MWGSTSTLLRWSHHDWPRGRKPRAIFWETVVLPQWVLRDSYPRTEGRAIWEVLPSSISSHQQGSAMMFSSMTSRLSSCWIVLWHQILALTSIWRYPLTLSLVFWTYKALGFTSELSRPKMMSCHFERLQFLEYYQEFKKSHPPWIQPALKVSRQSSGSLSNARCKHAILLTLYWLPILKPLGKGKSTKASDSVFFTSPPDASLISSFDLKVEKWKSSKDLCFKTWLF